MPSPIISVDVKIEDTDRGYNELVRTLTEKASHVDIGVHSFSGEELVVIATANEFGATIRHPGRQPFIIVDDKFTAKGRARQSRGQRSARVPLEGGKVLVFLKKGKKGMGVTKPHTIIILARSFIRSTVDMNREFYGVMAERLWNAIVDGQQGPKEALSLIGLRIQADIQRTIQTLKEPPNAPETIRRKGSDNPLVDTGTLVQSIRYAVKNPQGQNVDVG